MKVPLITIGESIHASIPKTAKVMKELAQLGTIAYSKQTEQLDYIKSLVESQANDGAGYIAVNLDAFGEDEPQICKDMMVEYVRLVRNWGNGVPICIDSSDNDVLIAGLKEWYNTEVEVRKPLINSVKTYTTDSVLPLKKDYDFSFIGLLVGEETSAGPGGSHSVDELFSNQLTQMYEKQPYPTDAVIPESTIMDVMAHFKLLRQADETIYLRTGTFNIINGTIGLTFSCDGYHLMSVDQFLSKDIQFWIGNNIANTQKRENISLRESA